MAVDGHHHGHAKDLLHVAHVLEQVGQALFEGLEVLLVEVGLGHAAVHLEGAGGGHDHHGVGREARHAALDVEELLGTQVGAEAGLGDHDVAQGERHAGGHDRVAAVGDVGEGAAVHKGGRALEGLDQVGLEGVLEQGRHGAGGLEVAGGHGRAAVGVAHHDAAQALLEVGDVLGEAEHSHDLGGHGDVEAVLARGAVGLAAEAVDHKAQLAIVHVDHALPGYLAGVDAELVALLDVVVEHGGQ